MSSLQQELGAQRQAARQAREACAKAAAWRQEAGEAAAATAARKEAEEGRAALGRQGALLQAQAQQGLAPLASELRGGGEARPRSTSYAGTSSPSRSPAQPCDVASLSHSSLGVCVESPHGSAASDVHDIVHGGGSGLGWHKAGWLVKNNVTYLYVTDLNRESRSCLV